MKLGDIGLLNVRIDVVDAKELGWNKVTDFKEEDSPLTLKIKNAVHEPGSEFCVSIFLDGGKIFLELLNSFLEERVICLGIVETLFEGLFDFFEVFYELRYVADLVSRIRALAEAIKLFLLIPFVIEGDLDEGGSGKDLFFGGLVDEVTVGVEDVLNKATVNILPCLETLNIVVDSHELVELDCSI